MTQRALQFRKRPVVIEAIRYLASDLGEHPYTFDWAPDDDLPQWLKDGIDAGQVRAVERGEDYWYLIISTLEGDMLAGPSDWIVRGVEGELYPVKGEIFKKTYEAVTS